MAGIPPLTSSNFGWWSSGQVTYFRERGPGSIRGVPRARVEEIVRFPKMTRLRGSSPGLYDQRQALSQLRQQVNIAGRPPTPK